MSLRRARTPARRRGNIYKGRVSKKAWHESAFVDIGLERDGSRMSDVLANLEDVDDGDEAKRQGGKGGEGAKGERRQAAVRARSRSLARSLASNSCFKAGTVVQVVKEPLGTKGARLTSHASLAGRFLVFMPTVDHVGVSRKIDSREERSRLRSIVRDFREKEGFKGGIIIRTAASGRPSEDILSDLQYFNRIWRENLQKLDTMKAPAVVYREQSLVAKLLRDLLTDDYTAIRIDSYQEYSACRAGGSVEYVARQQVKHYNRTSDLRESRQAELDKARFQQGGWSGGSSSSRPGARRSGRQHRPLRRQADGRPAQTPS